MTGPVSAACISTPVYLDPHRGPHCGSCRNCAVDDPYNPCSFGICRPHDRAVNIRRPTACTDYAPVRCRR